MADINARIDNERFNTDAEANAALSGKVGSRVFSKESKTWFFNNDGTIEQEKEYQAQIDSIDTSLSTLDGEVDALENRVNDVEADVATLEATVAGLAAGPEGPPGDQGPPGINGEDGGVVVLGSIASPFGVRFQPNLQNGTTSNPTLYCKVTSDFSENGIVAIYLATELVGDTYLDETPLGIELVPDGGGQIFNLYRYLTGTLLGSVSGLDLNVAGTFPIVADGDDTTIGYLVMRYIDPAVSVGPVAISVDLTMFSLERNSLGNPSGDFNTGKDTVWEFELDHYVSSTSLSSVDLGIALGGNSLKSGSGDITFTSVANTSGAKRFKLYVRVTYLGLEESGGDYFHGFRTEVSTQCWGASPFAALDAVVEETQLDHDSVPERAFFNFQITGVADSAATDELSQLSVFATRSQS